MSYELPRRFPATRLHVLLGRPTCPDGRPYGPTSINPSGVRLLDNPEIRRQRS
jgi:hypothetical protein